MEKELGSGFRYQPPEWQSSYLNILSNPPIVVGENSLPPALNPYLNPANGTSPLVAYSGLPPFKPNQHCAPSNWFCCSPCYRQAVASPLSSMPKGAFVPEQMEHRTVCGSPKAEPGSGQKRFLVFDQSGDQTTLIYSSAVGTPVQYLAAYNPKPLATSGFLKEDLIFKREAIPQYSSSLNADHNEYDLQSEMHEDTEEINALLCSDDDDDYSDDDEVTSTGHSPSAMTDHGIKLWPEEGDEEVASSASPFKRQKLLDGEYNLIANAGATEKPIASSEFEDDALSGCGNFENQVQGKSLSGKKRSRNDKIRETVSILRDIIPGVKGKDALVVFDEAIHYLKSLKVKVQSVGFKAL